MSGNNDISRWWIERLIILIIALLKLTWHLEILIISLNLTLYSGIEITYIQGKVTHCNVTLLNRYH